MEKDQLWKILESIQSQIRAFDTKAQITIGINGVMAGFVLTSTNKLWEYSADRPFSPLAVVSIIVSSLALAFAACSLFLGVWTIVARFKDDQPRSLTFFGHIAERFGEDYDKCAHTYSQLTDAEFSNHVSYQILTNSDICVKKARSFKWSLRLMSVGILFWFLSIAFTLASEYPARSNHKMSPCRIENNTFNYQY